MIGHLATAVRTCLRHCIIEDPVNLALGTNDVFQHAGLSNLVDLFPPTRVQLGPCRIDAVKVPAIPLEPKLADVPTTSKLTEVVGCHVDVRMVTILAAIKASFASDKAPEGKINRDKCRCHG